MTEIIILMIFITVSLPERKDPGWKELSFEPPRTRYGLCGPLAKGTRETEGKGWHL